METTNSFSALADVDDEEQVTTEEVNASPDNTSTSTNTNTKSKGQTTNKFPSNIPVNKLHLENIIYALKRYYESHTQNTPYGKAFYAATPTLRKLLETLDDMYAKYDETDNSNYAGANKCLWARTFRIFHINGDDLPATFTSTGASFKTVLRLVVGQCREINEKELMIRGSVVREMHCELQAEFEFICSDILGRQTEVEGRTSEPIVEELYNAFTVAQSAKKENYEKKQESIKEMREKTRAAYEARKTQQQQQTTSGTKNSNQSFRKQK